MLFEAPRTTVGRTRGKDRLRILVIGLFTTALVLSSVTGTVLYLRIVGRLEPTESRDTLGVITQLLYNFHEPSREVKGQLQELLKREPQLLQANSTNRGAEILWKMSPSPSRKPSDTDGDGLPELCDFWGEPLILLFDGSPEDRVITARGFVMSIEPPPYVDLARGVCYINCISFHAWPAEYAKNLRDEQHLLRIAEKGSEAVFKKGANRRAQSGESEQ